LSVQDALAARSRSWISHVHDLCLAMAAASSLQVCVRSLPVLHVAVGMQLIYSIAYSPGFRTNSWSFSLAAAIASSNGYRVNHPTPRLEKRMAPFRIAALLTCHNRAERTVSCLRSIYAAADDEDHSLDVVVVDAGSSDGTSDAIRESYPQATIIERGPDLFWNGGMRVAIARAYEHSPDLYLWLNDDVELDLDAISRLVACHLELQAARSAPCIVVGSTRDPDTGEHTYGGVVRPDRWRPMRYALVQPGTEPQRVETMNGNCVLVPREVMERIGNLAGAFTHGMGDYDYGHRAERAGCEVWIAPGTIGTCSRNAPAKRAGSLREERARLTSPTGGLPPAEWFTFVRRWGGPLWLAYAVSPYVRRSTRWLMRR
jgi:GT2 family glycosyltransferase